MGIFYVVICQLGADLMWSLIMKSSAQNLIVLNDYECSETSYMHNSYIHEF